MECFIFMYQRCSASFFFFFFNDTATTEIYTLSLHDALPICQDIRNSAVRMTVSGMPPRPTLSSSQDRKSTRLNSSHGYISYAVFCLKKKKKHRYPSRSRLKLASRTCQ